MLTKDDLPQYRDFYEAILSALTALGGSASISEVDSQVIEAWPFTEREQAVLHGPGPGTEIEYRLAWARTYLKKMGLITNSRRGVWSLTPEGQVVDRRMLPELHAAVLEQMKADRIKRAKSGIRVGADDAAAAEDLTDDPPDGGWQQRLLEQVMRLTPDEFERLAQRLLREEGFVNTEVTGRSHDGGIDGRGVYRLSLLSFPVFFQCKRCSGSVSAGAVRDFRGAMAGRGDQGLLITTGTFTPAARAEARRDGAPPIDLIDGMELCELLKNLRLGVEVRERVVEDVTVIDGFFEREF